MKTTLLIPMFACCIAILSAGTAKGQRTDLLPGLLNMTGENNPCPYGGYYEGPVYTYSIQALVPDSYILLSKWEIIPSYAGSIDPSFGGNYASGFVRSVNIRWNEGYDETTATVLFTGNVRTSDAADYLTADQTVGMVVSRTKYTPYRLNNREITVCPNSFTDLNANQVSNPNEGRWIGPHVVGGHNFDATSLPDGNHTLYYIKNNQSESPSNICGEATNKLTVKVRNILEPEDMLVIPPGAESIVLNSKYLWSGEGVSLVGSKYYFNPPDLSERSYELIYNPQNGCSQGKKIIVVKADKNLPVSTVAYMQTTTVLKENVTDASAIGNLPIGEVFSQRTYFDVFGRPIQSIAKQASPSGKDIVGFAIYDDPLGRSTKKYMGFTQGTDGLLKDDVLGKQQLFYQNTPEIAHSDFAYGKVEYENSAFSRVESVYASGESWVAAGVKSTARQSTNGTDYVRMLKAGFGAVPILEELVGIESELLLTVYDASQNDVKAKAGIEISQGFEIGEGEELALTIMELDGQITSDMFSRNQFYPANELVMAETRDEHGIISRSYTNKSGQTVMSESQSDSLGTKFLQTYYVYDDFGQPRYVFPPMAVEQLRENGWRITNNILKLITHYTYDHKGRVTISKVPDKGEIHTVYDILNRPVLSQDALQRAKSPQEWSFVKYDLYGRSTISGVFKSDQGREVLQQEADLTNQSLQTPGYRLYEEKTSDAVWEHYTNQAFPTLSPTDELEMVSYYDHYNFDEQGGADAAYDDLYDVNFNGKKPTPDYTRLLGKPTGSMTRQDNPDGSFKKWLKTYVFYDDKGRVIQGQATNHLGGTDIATIQYDYPGKVLATHLKHETVQTNVTQTIQVKERYEYDFLGRPLKSFQTIQKDSETAVAEEKLSEVRYNELGQVVEKKLGNGNLQTLNFNYNIRGWLTKFNDLENLDTDLFAFTLHYEDAQNPARSRLDGMVSSMEWKTASDNVERGYSYQYDALGRLENATYKGGNTGENYSENNLGYDANGNILKLDRFGLTSVGNYDKTDQLTYNYDGNRLLSVTDAVNTTEIARDFQDRNKAGNDYEYDLNGNLVADRNKGITAITYNSMDMPVMIVWENGNRIEYQYDRAGNKLNSRAYQKTTLGADSLVRETDYVGGFVYEENELSHMGTGEGRYLFKIRNVPSGGKTQGYEYYLTDHQGNLRVSFRKGDTLVYTAGMELENTLTENREFDNVASVRSTPGQGRTGAYAAKIDQSIPMGIWKTLKVNKGDKVDAEVWARYTQDATQNNGSGLGIYATTQVPNLTGGSDSKADNSAQLLMLGLTYSPNQNPNNNNTVPRAYLIGILYDSKGDPVETHRIEVTPNAKTDWEQLTKSITVSQAGQLQIFVANESNVAVFFDDMEITLSQHLISQENHYSPFGVNLVGIEKTGTNRFLYNAMTEKNTDFDLDWYETPFRSYDAQIGRFHQVDKLAGMYPGITPYHFALNNPVMMNDPTGLEQSGPDGPERRKRKKKRDFTDPNAVKKGTGSKSGIDYGLGSTSLSRGSTAGSAGTDTDLVDEQAPSGGYEDRELIPNKTNIPGTPNPGGVGSGGTKTDDRFKIIKFNQKEHGENPYQLWKRDYSLYQSYAKFKKRQAEVGVNLDKARNWEGAELKVIDLDKDEYNPKRRIEQYRNPFKKEQLWDVLFEKTLMGSYLIDIAESRISGLSKEEYDDYEVFSLLDEDTNIRPLSISQENWSRLGFRSKLNVFDQGAEDLFKLSNERFDRTRSRTIGVRIFGEKYTHTRYTFLGKFVFPTLQSTVSMYKNN